MKKQVLALALLGLTSVTFAQKNEVKALEKAIKSEKFTETKSLITAAEAVIGSADDKTKAKYYYLKAKAMLNSTDYDGIVKSLSEYEVNSKLKSNKDHEAEIAQLKNEITAKLVNDAIADQGKGDQKASAEKLYAAYKLSENDEYLYFSSTAYVAAKEYKMALPLYIELKDRKYTGVKTTYVAYNKETKVDDVFPNTDMRSIALKAGSHIKPTVKKTESVLPDIVKNIAYMFVELGDTEAAVEAIKEARVSEPTNVDLILTEANLYLKLGDKSKAKEALELALKQNDKNPSVLLVLGDISSELGDNVKAKEYYQKSLELNDSDVNANLNMAVFILKEEASLVEEMNSLGTSSADNRKYDVLEERRNVVYREAVPYLEKILSLDTKNENAALTLKNIYGVLGEMDKLKKVKALLESL